MIRHDMIERVGAAYVTANIEGGEYSYVQEAGSKEALENALGKEFKHFKLDIRFEDDDYVVLIETKQKFVKKDERKSLLFLQTLMMTKSRYGNLLLMIIIFWKMKLFLILWNITNHYLH